MFHSGWEWGRIFIYIIDEKWSRTSWRGEKKDEDEGGWWPTSKQATSAFVYIARNSLQIYTEIYRHIENKEKNNHLWWYISHFSYSIELGHKLVPLRHFVFIFLWIFFFVWSSMWNLLTVKDEQVWCWRCSLFTFWKFLPRVVEWKKNKTKRPIVDVYPCMVIMDNPLFKWRVNIKRKVSIDTTKSGAFLGQKFEKPEGIRKSVRQFEDNTRLIREKTIKFLFSRKVKSEHH